MDSKYKQAYLDLLNETLDAKADKEKLLDALEGVLKAIKMARTVTAPAGHYDEDVYYNGIDFGPQIDIASEIIAQVKGELTPA